MKDRNAAILFGLLGLLLLAYASGCSDPYTMYQASGAKVGTGETVLVMPFMDTRTFLAKNDPHRDDVGVYVRDIFADVLRERTAERGAEILTPDMPKQERSLSTAEIAEIGRLHGAAAVVAGQVFSFNATRAASIPPRAGMFVRVISSKTGAVLFAGDHYSASSVPFVGDDRDDQAHLVATKLVEGFLRESESRTPAAPAVSSAVSSVIASDGALANLSPDGETETETEEEQLPAVAPVVLVGKPLTPMHPAEVDELPELAVEELDASLARIDARAAVAEQFAALSGDALAEDLLSANGDVFDGRDPAPADRVASETVDTAASAAPAAGGMLVAAAPVSEVESATEVVTTEVLAATARIAASAPDNGPVVSEPMAFEQPRTQRVFDFPEDPAAASQDDDALVAAPARSGAEGALRVLILPYHDRENDPTPAAARW